MNKLQINSTASKMESIQNKISKINTKAMMVGGFATLGMYAVSYLLYHFHVFPYSDYLITIPSTLAAFSAILGLIWISESTIRLEKQLRDETPIILNTDFEMDYSAEDLFYLNFIYEYSDLMEFRYSVISQNRYFTRRQVDHILNTIKARKHEPWAQKTSRVGSLGDILEG